MLEGENVGGKDSEKSKAKEKGTKEQTTTKRLAPKVASHLIVVENSNEPGEDDDKVEYVPDIAQIWSLVEDEAEGENLQRRLKAEDT